MSCTWKYNFPREMSRTGLEQDDFDKMVAVCGEGTVGGGFRVHRLGLVGLACDARGSCAEFNKLHRHE